MLNLRYKSFSPIHTHFFIPFLSDLWRTTIRMSIPKMTNLIKLLSKRRTISKTTSCPCVPGPHLARCFLAKLPSYQTKIFTLSTFCIIKLQYHWMRIGNRKRFWYFFDLKNQSKPVTFRSVPFPLTFLWMEPNNQTVMKESPSSYHIPLERHWESSLIRVLRVNR